MKLAQSPGFLLEDQKKAATAGIASHGRDRYQEVHPRA